MVLVTRRHATGAALIFGLGLAACGTETRDFPGATASAGATVLVAGGSGQTGQHIMRVLAARGFKVRGLTTNVERAMTKAPGANYEWAAVDVRDPASMEGVFRGVRFVISAIGSGRSEIAGINPETVDYGGVKNLVDLAAKNGVGHFVLVSSGGATISDENHPFNRMSGNSLIWKFKAEEYLRASGLRYTIVRPANLNLRQETAYEPGTRGLVFDQGDRIFGQRGVVVHRADVAEVCVAATGDESAIGKTFELYADATVPVGQWRKGGFAALKKDDSTARAGRGGNQ